MQALPRRLQFKTVGFPHSDISGSKATNRLPEAFRRLVASFIAVLGQGIHRVLLCLSYGDLHITLHFLYTLFPFRSDAEGVPIYLLPSERRQQVYLHVFVCQRYVCLRKRKNRQKRFFRVYTRGPYGLSAPKKLWFFRFVDT